MQEDRNSFAFNISSVANQHMPTSAALILRKVESLLLRHCPSAVKLQLVILSCAAISPAASYLRRAPTLHCCCLEQHLFVPVP